MPPYMTATVQEFIQQNPSTTPVKIGEKLEFSPEDLAGYRSLWGTFGSPIKWFNCIFLAFLHIYFVVSLPFYPWINCFPTILWGVLLGNVGGFGVTGGAHRLWCHRSYKAILPLRYFIMICYVVAGQNTLYDWVLDHRVHHKYSETDADPHNANRGFFFAHCGWLMLKKHPQVINRGKQVDMSDLLADPVIRFHQKYFALLQLIFTIGLPCFVPVYFWGEDIYWSIATAWFARWLLTLHVTWSVNSAAHIWGYRSYDRNIQPAENVYVAFFAVGEGWHNYHHTFPWDYRAGELGHLFNATTFYLDLLAKLGWVYNCKSAPPKLIKRIAERTGDGNWQMKVESIAESTT